MPDTIERANTCATCAHWYREFEGQARGFCRLASSLARETEPLRAIALDYDGYHGKLETAPDFGCNQWQPRDSWGGSDRDEV